MVLKGQRYSDVMSTLWEFLQGIPVFQGKATSPPPALLKTTVLNEQLRGHRISGDALLAGTSTVIVLPAWRGLCVFWLVPGTSADEWFAQDSCVRKGLSTGNKNLKPT